MSVTIYPCRPGGRPFPYTEERRPCPACAEGYCQPGWCEDGTEVERVPTAPECNFANDNAKNLLATVGIDPGPYLTGEVEHVELAGILAECQAALAEDADGLVRRAPMMRAPEDYRGRHGARVVVCASGDPSAKRRLRSLLVTLQWAHDNQCGVAWS